jgi:sulfate transport system permease protein
MRARHVVIALVVVWMLVIVVLPVATIFSQALAEGWSVYVAALSEPAARSAILLTLETAAIVAPLNTIFGLAAAWALARFSFPGKNAITTLIDLPFAVSPVIAGMIFVLLFGAQGLAGPWLRAHGLQIIFAVPAIVIATLFVTLPFVARELLAFMQAQGRDDEEVALTLGANGWHMFWKVTLPNIKWSLLYGMILANARAMGEFGAVSVVSGHIRGATNTIPLHVEILYNEYSYAASFAVASLLVWAAVATLIVKKLIEWRTQTKGER